MAACVHEPFTGVDLCEIKIRNGLTLAGFERFANDLAFRVHDSGEATTGNLSWTPKTRQLVKVEPCP